MITGRQVRAARALLNWKQEMLAEKALVALTALKRVESERGLPVHETTRDQIRRALETAGVLFIDSERARRAWDSHLARARWMTENGYRQLLRGGAPH